MIRKECMIEKEDRFPVKEENSMRNHSKMTLLLFIALLLLTACSASIKEEQKAALETVKETFNKEPKAANNKNQDIEFYLPFGFEVKEETPNNIILKNGSKTYILFYNQHEAPDSKVVYETTLKLGEYDLNETFTNKERLGYFLINHLEKDKNELIVGVGGVKITTEAKTKGLSAEATAMIDIVNSVKIND